MNFGVRSNSGAFTPFRHKSLRDVINEISDNCRTWLDEFSYHAPSEVVVRRKYMNGFKCILKALLGLFVSPRFENLENIYIFVGIRNGEHMKVFLPNTVVILGSHLERDYARKHGYGFCWSFPMESATQLKIVRDWNFFVGVQVIYWAIKLSKLKRIIIFLSEDTQPLGCFMVSVCSLLHEKATSVCIQHGYLCERDFPLRVDGALSDINFVWDNKQVKLQEKMIGKGKRLPIAIGLPYSANAKPTTEMQVVLVGAGMAADGTDYHKRSIDTYITISRLLSNVAGVKVVYKPHPNELSDVEQLAKLKDHFVLADCSNIMKLLDGPRAVFIGSISSLLYEAEFAGHIIAHLNLHSDIRPIFEYDFKFNENETTKLLQWILDVKNSGKLQIESPKDKHLTFSERFNVALRDGGLIN